MIANKTNVKILLSFKRSTCTCIILSSVRTSVTYLRHAHSRSEIKFTHQGISFSFLVYYDFL